MATLLRVVLRIVDNIVVDSLPSWSWDICPNRDLEEPAGQSSGDNQCERGGFHLYLLTLFG